MIVVFHRTSDRKNPIVEHIVKHFDPVAVVDIPDWAYERTFRLTNSIDSAWWSYEANRQFPDRVQPIFLGAHQWSGCRSTSVGDRVMLSDGRVMEVRGAGWREVAEGDNAIYWNKARWGFYITPHQPEDVQAS